MSDLLGAEYKKQLNQLHSAGVFNNGRAAYEIVRRFLSIYNPSSILDFGCGHGELIRVIAENHPSARLYGYDPGNKDYQSFPDVVVDSLVSTDVLEHIEPNFLDDTLSRIEKTFSKYAFFRIACYPAMKSLPDGRNAHLIVENPDWWRKKILSNMGVVIVKERILAVDKTFKYPGVKGYNYDLVVRKKDFHDRNSFRSLRYIYLSRRM